MTEAVMALSYHWVSTDGDPQQYCPTGPSSWCKYRAISLFQFEELLSHNPLPPANLLPFFVPIFRALSKRELLEKCLLVATQNRNEFQQPCVGSVTKDGICLLRYHEIYSWTSCSCIQQRSSGLGSNHETSGCAAWPSLPLLTWSPRTQLVPRGPGTRKRGCLRKGGWRRGGQSWLLKRYALRQRGSTIQQENSEFILKGRPVDNTRKAIHVLYSKLPFTLYFYAHTRGK